MQLIFGQELPTEYKSNVSKADSLFKIKEYKNSALAYSLAFKANGWKGELKDRYNAARAWTLINEPDSAFYHLNKIVYIAFFDYYDNISKEEDFKALYADNRWQPLLEQVKKNELPEGWHRNSNNIKNYAMSIDSSMGKKRENVYRITSKLGEADDFGELEQTILPNKYWGEKIRLTGHIKTNEVAVNGLIWIRIIRQKPNQVKVDDWKRVSFTGTADRKKYEIDIDVPKNVTKILYGVTLYGVGQIWFDELYIDIEQNPNAMPEKKNDVQPRYQQNKRNQQKILE